MTSKRGNICFLVFFAFYVVYLLAGAAVFTAVEQPIEKQTVQRLKTMKDNFYSKISSCVSEEELDNLLELMLEANDRGISVVSNASRETNWGFGQSFFFSGSIVTTIGYGHVTPLSEVGRVFCIIYAAIGIPLTLVMMTTLVERLLVPSTCLFKWLQGRLGPTYKTVHIRLLHLFIILAFLIIFVFLLPSVIFMLIEPRWTYIDSLYYCVISMTTIGLGDYVPGEEPEQNYRQLYKICATAYLIIGLMMMMLTLATVYEIPELSFSRFCLARDPDDNEGNKLLRDDERGVSKYTPQVNEAYESEPAKAIVSRQTSKQ